MPERLKPKTVVDVCDWAVVESLCCTLVTRLGGSLVTYLWGFELDATLFTKSLFYGCHCITERYLTAAREIVRCVRRGGLACVQYRREKITDVGVCTHLVAVTENLKGLLTQDGRANSVISHIRSLAWAVNGKQSDDSAGEPKCCGVHAA